MRVFYLALYVSLFPLVPAIYCYLILKLHPSNYTSVQCIVHEMKNLKPGKNKVLLVRIERKNRRTQYNEKERIGKLGTQMQTQKIYCILRPSLSLSLSFLLS